MNKTGSTDERQHLDIDNMTKTEASPSIRPIDKNSAEARSADLVQGNLERLKALFPEVVVDGGIDFEILKSLLGAAVDEREEKYGLNWHGKRRARQLALTPSAGTLRPCPEESLDWDTTQNLMIEGDNLEVLKLLQKSYAGKVKLIYIDPPYNTGKDFVYPDNFQDSIKNYLEVTGQVEGGQRISSNTDASGRFHTDWLNMLYPRLRLSRSLLRDDGVIFVSIGDQEVARLRLVLDEIYGEENFIANIVWQKKQSPQNDATNVSDMHDHIIIYAKHAKQARSDDFGWQRNKVAREAEQEARYENKDNDPRGAWTSADLTCNKTSDERPNLYYGLRNPISGAEVWPSKTRVWAYERSATTDLLAQGKIWWGKDGTNMPRLKIFRTDVDEGVVPSTWWTREFAGDNQDARRELRSLFPEGDVFDTPKPIQLIKRILELGTDSSSGDIVMDFFCGSATVGHAVMEKNHDDAGNRRFIVVQLPEPVVVPSLESLKAISKISIERLRRAAKKFTLLNAERRGDIGFRTFRLDNSNIRAWNPNSDDLTGTLLDNIEHLLPDRSEQDVLYELLLKLGLDLSVPIESREIAGKTVHNIGAGALITCLSDGIDREVAEPLALGIAAWQKEQSAALMAGADDQQKAVATKLVFKDSAFADDVAKTNLAAILGQHGLDDVRSI